MEGFVHARLSKEDLSTLKRLRKATGNSTSDLIRKGLRLLQSELDLRASALDRAGTSAGKFHGGPHDLATNKKHLDGFGQ